MVRTINLLGHWGEGRGGTRRTDRLWRPTPTHHSFMSWRKTQKHERPKAGLPLALLLGRDVLSPGVLLAVFSFLYFFKIKISKIYVRFEIFQKYPPVAPHRATGLKCIFFLQIRNEVPGEKKGPVAPPTGDRGLSPVGGATRPFYKP